MNNLAAARGARGRARGRAGPLLLRSPPPQRALTIFYFIYILGAPPSLRSRAGSSSQSSGASPAAGAGDALTVV